MADEAPSPAYLGVTSSATGRFWRGPTEVQARLAGALIQQQGLHPLVAQVLARQGVAPGDAAAWLEPRLRDLMPDPSVLQDMDRAAARFVQALAQGEKIAVFADYDVDGGASAALLITWLRAAGREATLYIPDRIDEGYGPNEPAMQALGTRHGLILCVDCGTLSPGPIAAAGCDVIVLDHHLAGPELPPALAVVNPNRQDQESGLGDLCAAGVVFLFLVAVNRLRRAAGQAAPDLLPMLDLVALATVADVAPLRGLNRAFVRQGLAVMAGRGRAGLSALADVARLTSPPGAWHLGFAFGPRINAGGRIGAADLGARLLITTDPAEAEMLAVKLNHLNEERRAIEAGVLAEAMAAVEARGPGPLAWAAGEGWHPGVLGIVAARLKEAFDRPAVVIGLSGGLVAGIGKGSGRSVAGFDLGSAVQILAAEGLIEKGGGHVMAAGLSLSAGQVEPAMARLGELAARAGTARPGPKALTLAGLIAPGAADVQLFAALEAAGPYGAAAPAPLVAMAGLRVTFAKRVGTQHLQLRLSDGRDQIGAILFRAFDGPLGPLLEDHGGRAFHFAGELEADDWQGRRRIRLRLVDAAPSAAQGA